MCQSVPELGRVLIRWLLYTGGTVTIAVEAIYENGVFKPKQPVQLQERTEVDVLISTHALSDGDPTDSVAAQVLIGFIDDALQTWPNTTTSSCTADRASDLRRHRISLRLGVVEGRAPRTRRRRFQRVPKRQAA